MHHYGAPYLYSQDLVGGLSMPAIVVPQAKEYSQDLHHNIPLDWTVHHTPSGYMDRDGWLKSMTQLSNICGASPVNNQILFFDGQDIHFNDRVLTQMQRGKFSPSYLKRMTPSTTRKMTMGLTQNLSISTTLRRLIVSGLSRNVDIGGFAQYYFL